MQSRPANECAPDWESRRSLPASFLQVPDERHKPGKLSPPRPNKRQECAPIPKESLPAAFAFLLYPYLTADLHSDSRKFALFAAYLPSSALSVFSAVITLRWLCWPPTVHRLAAPPVIPPLTRLFCLSLPAHSRALR